MKQKKIIDIKMIIRYPYFFKKVSVRYFLWRDVIEIRGRNKDVIGEKRDTWSVYFLSYYYITIILKELLHTIDVFVVFVYSLGPT